MPPEPPLSRLDPTLKMRTDAFGVDPSLERGSTEYGVNRAEF